MVRTLSFEESLKAFQTMFTNTHPSFTMEWVDAKYRQYLVGEFASHFTDKPNVRFRMMFRDFAEFCKFNEIYDLGDGYKTWRI